MTGSLSGGIKYSKEGKKLPSCIITTLPVYWSKKRHIHIGNLDPITCDMPYLLLVAHSSELRYA